MLDEKKNHMAYEKWKLWKKNHMAYDSQPDIKITLEQLPETVMNNSCL